ncbi:hypothetical protein OVY01_10665 [Robbsia sp. Bb-Pol-6]|uniref:Transposase n=1 Tax=Robbsia betulipollinis TaxID=2981849 RepID=A0ABT3ZMJ1_9BURK|nr:hypothetical protein [Robbsia betulipollinis]MCY0387687.1 hypothetical protein [Robbsia betulipollinis]
MTDFIKPQTMILTLQALQHMGRCQLSVGLIACFRFGAAHLDSLLSETASHALWSRLVGPLIPIDSGIPAKTQRIIVHDGYTLVSAPRTEDADPPCLFGSETITLESKLRGRPAVSIRLPGIRAQGFVEWNTPSGKQVRKLDARIEGLRVSPRLGCAWLLYRAMTPLAGACVDDIVGMTADWGAIDRPTARPGHCLPAGPDRCAVTRHRHAAEREAQRQGLAGATCRG